MPPRAIRARCAAFCYCPSPLGNVTHQQILVWRAVPADTSCLIGRQISICHWAHPIRYCCAHLQIPVFRSVSMVNVGAAIRRPCGKILRIRIGFRRIRNMMLRGRARPAPTVSTAHCAININLKRSGSDGDSGIGSAVGGLLHHDLPVDALFQLCDMGDDTHQTVAACKLRQGGIGLGEGIGVQ